MQKKNNSRRLLTLGVLLMLPLIAGAQGIPAFNTAPGPGQAEKSAQVPTPFVNLPVGATEDRVLGTLDVERAKALHASTRSATISRARSRKPA